MALSGVYQIRNTENGMVYTGESDNIYRRWRQHRYRLRQGNHDTPLLQKDWAAAGSRAEAVFDFRLIFIEPDAERRAAGETSENEKIPVDLRYNQGNTGTKAVTRGATRTDAQRLNISRAQGGCPFFCRSRATGDLRRFLHTGEAVAAGFSRSKVLLCLYGQTPSHKDHVFYYDETFVPPPPKEKKAPAMDRTPRGVTGTSPSGEEKAYSSISDVVLGGFSRTGVSKCLAGIMERSGGWRWRYTDGMPHRKMPEEVREKLIGVERRGLNKSEVREE